MADRDREEMEDMVEDMAAGMVEDTVVDTVADRDKDYSLHMDNMTYSIISY
jgi:hypothetical protein